jgi:putative transposase
MPWSQTSPMDQKTFFIADCRRGLFTVAELCRRYSISRKTAYKWIERYMTEGAPGLRERSRRPLSCPHETPTFIVETILAERRRHPSWGGKKLLTILERRHPDWSWPSRSTACEILHRHGLIAKHRRRRKIGHPGKPETAMTEPNGIWTADFKGHFRTGDGVYCYPLTVADGYSRFLLGCQCLLHPSLPGTRATFLRLFHEYGLPKAIRTDNGAPFATTALHRLSKLSVWWIRLGIRPELIEPAHPEQNGRHERMHRTLKAETTRPPAGSLPAQQRRFTRFKWEFNNERPHEALGQETPASFYQPSPRPYPRRLPEVEYPAHFETRYVSRNGGIRWNSGWVCVTTALMEQNVGLEEVDDGLWDVYYGPVMLGRLHERKLRIEDAHGRMFRKQVSPMSPD